MMSDQLAVGIEILHSPRRVTVVCMLAVFELIAEHNIQIRTVVHALDRTDATINLDHHPDLSELNTAVADHVFDELLCFAQLLGGCDHSWLPRIN
ncbi:hypothetical protein ACM7NO_26415 [Pseudomonas aeruginosa]